MANGVSKLHGEVSRHMWKDYPEICEITHVTNAQNKKYWADHGLEHARTGNDIDIQVLELRHEGNPVVRRLGRAYLDHPSIQGLRGVRDRIAFHKLDRAWERRCGLRRGDLTSSIGDLVG